MANNTRSLDELISLLENTNWDIEEQRLELFSQFWTLIENWEGQLPNLSNIFHFSQMNWLILQDCIRRVDRKIVEFAILTGYKDSPVVGEDGRPVMNYSTPIHYWGECEYDSGIVSKLFRIYDTFDVNFIDDYGYTHLHVACRHGLYDVAEKFLELGHNPDYLLMPGSDESALHLALTNDHNDVAILLLEAGANPNLPDCQRTTPLHLIFQRTYDKLAEIPCGLDIAVRPMLALTSDFAKMVEVMMRRGGDPNVADARGRTPLHIACQGQYNIMMAYVLMQNCKDLNWSVMMKAQDEMGRTALDVALEHRNLILAAELPRWGREYFIEREKN